MTDWRIDEDAVIAALKDKSGTSPGPTDKWERASWLISLGYEEDGLADRQLAVQNKARDAVLLSRLPADADNAA